MIKVCYIITIAFLVVGCSFGVPRWDLTGGPHYFSNWKIYKFQRKAKFGYNLPQEPYNRITREEALELERGGGAYIEAHFDKQGRITVYKKHFGRNINLIIYYTYNQNDRLTRIVSMSADEGFIRVWNGMGDLLEERELREQDLEQDQTRR